MVALTIPSTAGSIFATDVRGLVAEIRCRYIATFRQKLPCLILDVLAIRLRRLKGWT